MADGVAITAGSGTTILTDDTGAGGHAQVVKLAISTDGSGTLVPAEATNGLDVDVTRVQGTVTAKETRAATSAVTSVNDAATSATLLASNANRLKLTIHNDSTAILYVKYGTTASSTDYSYRLTPQMTLEDNTYTGRIDGIWASDASGAAKITELTA